MSQLTDLLDAKHFALSQLTNIATRVKGSNPVMLKSNHMTAFYIPGDHAPRGSDTPQRIAYAIEALRVHGLPVKEACYWIFERREAIDEYNAAKGIILSSFMPRVAPSAPLLSQTRRNKAKNSSTPRPEDGFINTLRSSAARERKKPGFRQTFEAKLWDYRLDRGLTAEEFQTMELATRRRIENPSIQADPKFVAGQFSALGLILHVMGQYEEAIASYRDAMERWRIVEKGQPSEYGSRSISTLELEIERCTSQLPPGSENIFSHAGVRRFDPDLWMKIRRGEGL